MTNQSPTPTDLPEALRPEQELEALVAEFDHGLPFDKTSRDTLVRVAAALRARGAVPSDDEGLRLLLCITYCGALAYLDDDEMSDSRAWPCIDFKRDSVAQIRDKMQKRNQRTAAPQPPAALPGEQDAERYRLVRRGQHWSVVDGIGDHLRGDELDAAVDAKLARRAKGLEGGAPDIGQDARDAARYRAIRDVSEGVSIASTWNGNDGHTLHIKGDELDECADSWVVIAKDRAAEGRTDGGAA